MASNSPAIYKSIPELTLVTSASAAKNRKLSNRRLLWGRILPLEIPLRFAPFIADLKAIEWGKGTCSYLGNVLTFPELKQFATRQGWSHFYFSLSSKI